MNDNNDERNNYVKNNKKKNYHHHFPLASCFRSTASLFHILRGFYFPFIFLFRSFESM